MIIELKNTNFEIKLGDIIESVDGFYLVIKDLGGKYALLDLQSNKVFCSCSQPEKLINNVDEIINVIKEEELKLIRE